MHPAIAAAALGMGVIPILVHLINRRRYRRVTWAAMSFLLAANRRSARRVRLEQWALLAARIAIIVLVGWAIARPYLPASAWIPLGNGAVASRAAVRQHAIDERPHRAGRHAIRAGQAVRRQADRLIPARRRRQPRDTGRDRRRR